VDPSSEDPELRFAREIRFQAALQHPNILPVHDSGHVLDMLYYVVPYVEGMTLREKLNREKQLTLPDAICIARELADAIDYAHRAGVIHRDIKPENILLSGPHVMLCDFGVALAIGTIMAPKLTKPGMGGPGTPAYMSPEQLLGDHDIDTRTDIYGLATVFFEMLAGKPPFTGKAGFVQRFTEAPPALADVRPDIRPHIDQALKRALARLPADRFSTATEFVAELEETEVVRSTPTRSRVPTPIAPLIGREGELASISELLATNRLVTLVGVGGVGKTRIAEEIASRSASAFRDGCCMVALGAVEAPELLAASIAEALGLTFSGRASPDSQLLDILRDRQLLLVLDGFDHFVGRSDLPETIVKNAAEIKLLVTSRERLNIWAETVCVLKGLALPTLDASGPFGDQPAIRLFLERARRNDSLYSASSGECSAIARICHVVGGLPLGIEIAAAMTRVLSAGEIADELAGDLDSLAAPGRDVPVRHRSLRAVFEQSWGLLTAPERLALMGLSVLRGRFGREAAMRVADASLSVIVALIDKSLLQRNHDGSFALHDVVCQFASEKLKGNPSRYEEALDALSVYFAEHLALRQPDLYGPGLYSTLDEFADNIENIRTGWRRAIDQGRLDHIAMYAQPMCSFYVVRGRYEEGSIELALADPMLGRHPLSAFLLARRAHLYHAYGNVIASREVCRRALAIVPGLPKNACETGVVFAAIGYIAGEHGKLRASSRFFRRAIPILRAHAPEWELGYTLINWGSTQLRLGDYRGAEATCRDALGFFTRIGEPRARTIAQLNLSVVIDEDRPLEAHRLQEECVATARELGDRFLLGAALLNFAHSCYVTGQYERARESVGEAHKLLGQLRRYDALSMCHHLLGTLALAARDPDRAAIEFRRALELADSVSAFPLTMLILPEIAELLATLGDRSRAARLAVALLRHPLCDRYVKRRSTEVLASIRQDDLETVLRAERAIPRPHEHLEIMQEFLAIETSASPSPACESAVLPSVPASPTDGTEPPVKASHLHSMRLDISVDARANRLGTNDDISSASSP
jgi:predicted ATPase